MTAMLTGTIILFIAGHVPVAFAYVSIFQVRWKAVKFNKCQKLLHTHNREKNYRCNVYSSTYPVKSFEEIRFICTTLFWCWCVLQEFQEPRLLLFGIFFSSFQAVFGRSTVPSDFYSSFRVVTHSVALLSYTLDFVVYCLSNRHFRNSIITTFIGKRKVSDTNITTPTVFNVQPSVRWGIKPSALFTWFRDFSVFWIGKIKENYCSWKIISKNSNVI